MPTIITKNSSTASSVPLNTQLVQGELAVNVTDKRLFTENASGTVVELGTNPSSLTLPNGVANAVCYLNGSKVLTTGSALVFDGSNLGLGVTPSAWGSAFKVIEGGGASANGAFAFNTGSNGVDLYANTYWNGTSHIYKNTGRAGRFAAEDGSYIWYTAPSGTAGNAITFTQAMTLDAGGLLSLGRTTPFSSDTRLNVQAQSGGNGMGIQVGTNGFYAIYINNTSGTTVGGIIGNSASVSYNTTSDYRLKENIQPMTGALAKVAALKPVTYVWKADGSECEGFIAHELQEVCPHAVTGQKDAVDADGNPKYQGIDTSFLVATLTAAIQEQQAIINAQSAALEQLKADVAALKAAK